MNDQTRSEVLRRWYGGQSMRRIARDLHLSRKTVSRIIAEHQQQRATGTTGLPAPRQTRGSLVDSYETALREYLARYPDISVVRLLEEMRRRGYGGGYTILRQRVKQLRPQRGRPPVERFETGPGVQAQMDYAVYTLDFARVAEAIQLATPWSERRRRLGRLTPATNHIWWLEPMPSLKSRSWHLHTPGTSSDRPNDIFRLLASLCQ